ncbi:MAG: hypothetical protein B7Y84_11455 [Azorhizobium sp. 32-67-21]|nr:MAG: hypothetical protein B7Y84_11455 [Azorhizobium sp. 32-67-21]
MTDVWNSFGPSGGRRHGPTARPQTLTVDVHSHVGVPAAAKIVEGHLDISTIPLARYGTPDTKELNRKQDADRRSRMMEYDDRLKDMDAAGIDKQLIMCPPPQCYYTVKTDIAAKASRVVNDGLAEYVAGRPDRFVALGTVPLQDGHMAAAELEYVMSLGMKGVQILTNVAGKELSDPEFAPFWAKALHGGLLGTHGPCVECPLRREGHPPRADHLSQAHVFRHGGLLRGAA